MIRQKYPGTRGKNLGSQEKNLEVQEKYPGVREKNLGVREKYLEVQEKYLGVREKNLGTREKFLHSEIFFPHSARFSFRVPPLGGNSPKISLLKQGLGTRSNPLL
ncbi:MAG: hypothetical protein LUM44_14955 [Pyrinomonadaceae bacterium]|nr:hypothetical protein [Pyrinomonadaceae bacterium]